MLGSRRSRDLAKQQPAAETGSKATEAVGAEPVAAAQDHSPESADFAEDATPVVREDEARALLSEALSESERERHRSADLERRMHALLGANQKFEAERDRALAAVRQLERSVAELTATREAGQEELNHLRDVRARLETHQAEMHAHAEAERARLEAAIARVGEFEQTLTAANAKLASQATELDEAKRLAAQADGARREAQKNASEQRAGAERELKLRTEMQASHAAARTDRQEAEQRAAALTAELASVMEAKQTADDRIAVAKERLEHFNTALTEARTESDRHAEALAASQAVVTALQAEVTEATDARDALTAQIENERTAAEQRLDGLRKQAEAVLELAHREHESALTATREELDAAHQQEMEAARAELETVRATAEQRFAEATAATQEELRLRIESTTLLERSRARAETLESELATARARIDEIDAALAAATGAAQTAGEERDERAETIAELRSRLVDVHAAVAELEQLRPRAAGFEVAQEQARAERDGRVDAEERLATAQQQLTDAYASVEQQLAAARGDFERQLRTERATSEEIVRATRAEADAEVTAARADIDARIAASRAEVEAQAAALRSESAERIAELEQRANALEGAEQRMADAMQERLERVIEAEQRARQERDTWRARVDAESARRADEMAIADRRIAEARRVLEEARVAGERELDDRAALERRLSQIAELETTSTDEAARGEESANEPAAGAEPDEPPDWLELAQREAARHRESDPASAAAGDEPKREAEPEPAPLADDEPADRTVVADDSPTAVSQVPPAPAPKPAAPALFKTPDLGSRRPRAFKRRRKGADEGPGGCAVCARKLPAESDWEIRRSGWAGSGGTYLCDTCQADGWRLPEGASLPYRAHAERSQ